MNPTPIAERQSEVNAIHAEIFAQRNRQRDQRSARVGSAIPNNLDDVALLNKARKAKHGVKFSALYDVGDTAAYKSRSEADFALCSMLAFWTGRDRARMDALFRCSALMREKWNRIDYRERTLDTAIQRCSETYTPRQSGNKKTKRAQAMSGDKCNAARIASSIHDHDRFARDEGGKLYVFRDGCYRAKGEEYIRERVRRIAPDDKWTSHLASETVEYIRVGSPRLWDSPPINKLNLLNGVLSIDTLILAPHSPEFLSPLQLPVQYDPSATCPAWEAQISATFPDDAVEQGVAWEIIAWLMVSYTSIQKALLLLGPGGTGKSTFLTALTNFLGTRNISTLPLQKIENDRFAASRLIGKLANICADLPSTHLETSSMFKAITGGDSITAEYKFKDSFDFVPFARLIFSANQPPQSKDATDAFFQRWYVLLFEKVFRGTESEVPREELDTRLTTSAELSGVLNHALRALPHVRKHGLTVTESMRKAHLEFWQTTDPLAIWLLRNTIELPDAFVPRSVLINAYNASAAREGRVGMTEKMFGSALRRLRPNVRDIQRTVAN
jgi:putative DNA primase/helicase